MSAPKVIQALNGYQGDVVVSTEADGAIYSWTVRDREIFGGGIISPAGAETENHNAYRLIGDKWQSYTTEEESHEVSDEIAAHLALADQTAASFLWGRVQ
jgi:hypothetical protein